ncbi:MAG TPA: redoxin family protein, partial [Terriglobales bacterium]|nr:redoxin family protein [Terriglobales bacterium]
TGTPAAQALYAKGQKAQSAGNDAAALQYFQRAIAADPGYADAQSDYVFAYQLAAEKKQTAAGKPAAGPSATDQLTARYQALAAAHPRDPVYPWVLGSLCDEDHPQQAIAYYRQALQLDPRYAPAYAHLSYLDESRGDLAASREDLHQAALLQPHSPKAQFNYAYSFKNDDPARFRQLSEQVVRDYPRDPVAGQVLYWLAESASTDQARLRYLLQLRQGNIPGDWVTSGDELLFEIYDRTDRAQALAVAREMAKADADGYTAVLNYAQAMSQADAWLAKGNGNKALAALGNEHLPRYMPQQPLALMRARAQAAAGQPQAAYDGLLDFVAKTPTPATLSALLDSGRKLGKSPTQVANAVWAARAHTAHAAVSFDLANYQTGKQTSLADLRGHVFLLNFFFPMCGPCRGEFPYIRTVLNKYRSQGFRIVTINVEPQRDAFVLPELKGFGLDFIPLRGSNEWAKKNYKVRGEPTSFLIGADGRVYFGPIAPVSSPDSQQTLEMQIAALLRHAAR